jgi:CheY-like chemotaxis protein
MERAAMKVIDGSYTQLTLSAAQKLRAQGYGVWVQCLWTGAEQPEYRIENLRNAVAAGLLIAGYISVTGEYGGGWHVEQARTGVPDDLWAQLRLVFVDVELSGIPVTTVRDAVEAVAALGKRRAIYTSNHVWVDFMGNPITFTDCLLWDANWDGRDALELVRRYGNWTEAQLVGKQFHEGEQLDGVFVDLDEFDDALVQPEEDMADNEARRMAQVDSARMAAGGLALADSIQALVSLLVLCKILPPDTVAAYPSLDEASRAQQVGK